MNKSVSGLSKRLRSVRGVRSVREFAADIGVSHQAVTQCELGNTLPSLPTLLAIARVEKINLNWLGFGKGDKYL